MPENILTELVSRDSKLRKKQRSFCLSKAQPNEQKSERPFPEYFTQLPPRPN